MKVNDDYKEDNVRPFDFQDEIDRIRKENESLKELIANLETRMATVEINIKDVNHNAKELRNDVDRSVKYTIKLKKLDLAPRKVAKYINKVHDIKKDMANLKKALPSGSPTNDSFAEKLKRSKLIERELENLRNMLDTLAANDQKTVEEQTKLFKSYGWKLSNCIYRMTPYISAEEKEKLDNACNSVRNDKRQSPKHVMKAIQNFIDTIKNNIYQRNSDMKLKGKEFQYHFPHLDDDIDDDDDGCPQ